MADPKGALSTLDETSNTDEVVDKPTTGGLATPTQISTTKGGAQIINPKIASYSDPESSKAILENMQRMIEQKEKQQNSLLTALNLASAYGSGGTEGPQRQVQAQMAQHEAGNTEIFNMRQAIAQQKAAQRQREVFDTANQSQGWGLSGAPATGGAPGAAPTTGAAPSLKPTKEIVDQFNTIRMTEGDAAANKFKNTWLQKQQELSTQYQNKLGEIQHSAQYTPGYLKAEPTYRHEIGDNIDLNTEEVKTLNATGKLPDRYSDLQPKFDEFNAKRGKPAAPAAAPVSAPAAPVSTDKSSLQQTSYQSPVSGTVVRGVTPSHGGVDIAVPVNTPVAATQSGTLRYNTSNKGGWGNAAEIVDSNGKVIERLAHLNKFTMPEGSVVKTGDKIGLSGGQQGAPGAGNSQGPHVHHELPGSNAFQNVSLKNPRSSEDVKAQQKLEFEIQQNKAKLAEELKQAGPIEAAKQRAIKDEKARETFLAETEPALTSKQRNIANAAEKLVLTDPKIVGVFSDPGFLNAAGALLNKGLEIGKMGSVSINLEDMYLQAFDKGYTKQGTVDRATLKQLFADLELDKSKILNGQGPISDNERLLLSRAVGGVSDPAELIVKTARALREMAYFRDEARQIHRSMKNVPLEDFKDSNAYLNLVKKYEDRFDKLHAEKISISKPAAPNPSGAKSKVDNSAIIKNGEAIAERYRVKPQ
jgi:murein DD-endopeptidase MepM/ murein hydrolase activator NlpD